MNKHQRKERNLLKNWSRYRSEEISPLATNLSVHSPQWPNIWLILKRLTSHFPSINMSDKLWLLLLWRHERWERVHWCDSGLWGLSAREARKVILAGPSSQKKHPNPLIWAGWVLRPIKTFQLRMEACCDSLPLVISNLQQINITNNFWEIRLSPDTNMVDSC